MSKSQSNLILKLCYVSLGPGHSCNFSCRAWSTAACVSSAEVRQYCNTS